MDVKAVIIGLIVFCCRTNFSTIRSIGIYWNVLLAGVVLRYAYLIWRSWTPKRISPQLTSSLNPLQPLLFPCQTTHRRLFPQKHAFSYSYLYLGVPVGHRCRYGRFLSIDPDAGDPATCFGVHAADHLARDLCASNLRGKLDAFLASEGKSAQHYPIAYLVTAPRFLGYSFNPVSFWYLYDSSQRLQAMILEVNNTFGERRAYLLESSSASNEKLSARWPKDFHVSPFNSRKGSYSLSAVDPFTNQAGINNVITLMSSKGSPKLVASVVSTATSMHPASMSEWQRMHFIYNWFWTGFLTFPRILKEAFKLFFYRRLHVWYRPEVLSTSIGRSAFQEESTIASAFSLYLRHLVESHRHTSLVFSSSVSPPVIFASGPDPIEFKVATPLFYSQLAASSDILHTMRQTLEPSDPLRQTAYTTSSSHLIDLFRTQRTTSSSQVKGSSSQNMRKAYGFLFAQSQLDIFAQSKLPLKEWRRYSNAVLRIRLARYLAFGSLSLLSIYALILKICGYWLMAEALWLFVQSG